MRLASPAEPAPWGAAEVFLRPDGRREQPGSLHEGSPRKQSAPLTRDEVAGEGQGEPPGDSCWNTGQNAGAQPGASSSPAAFRRCRRAPAMGRASGVQCLTCHTPAGLTGAQRLC